LIKVYVALCTNRGSVPQAEMCHWNMLMRPPDNILIIPNMGLESLIDRARSIEATKFLEFTDGDVLLFIDDDILFNPSDIKSVVENCLKTNAIVGGTYMLKRNGNVLAVRTFELEVPIKLHNGLFEVMYVPTGFMAIPRKILDAVSKTMERCNIGRNTEMYPLFMPFALDHDYKSEDYAFCERARQLGYKVYLDTDTLLGHVGQFPITPE
jgi:hypothetical protein